MSQEYLKRLGAFVGLAAGLAVAFSAPVLAAQEIVLIADQSQYITLPEAPATIVVGNPAIADVTTDGNILFLHPRGFGLTNLVLLDSKGAKLGDYRLRVVFEDADSVSVYTPAGRQTFTCRRDCEPAMRVGDESGHLGGYISQLGAKNGFAQSQALGEDLLLPRADTSSTTTQ